MRKITKGVLILLSLITFTTILGIKRLYSLAKTPQQSKPCLFVFPTADTGKPTTLTITPPEWLTQTKFTNDASCLNKTPIYGIIQVTKEEDIRNALLFAQMHGIPITPAGQQHSMGGQSFHKNGIVLNMRPFKNITIDIEKKIAHVQGGATWQDLQHMIDPLGLSIQAMQSINIFTIGGTLSVNAHGIAHKPGPVAETVLSIRVMLPNGSVVTASRTENQELFSHVLGGYGLFGVLLDADLQLVDNATYDWHTVYVSYRNFPSYFTRVIKDNPTTELFFARLSVSPTSFLEEVAVHTFNETTVTEAPPIKPIEPAWVQRLIFNLSKTGPSGRFLRWTLEKHIGKKLAPCVKRSTALEDPYECLIVRNQAMHDSMSYLKNELKDTDILQEYFISPEHFPDFIDELKTIVQKNQANLLNITIRYVHKDEITALPYAKEDMFALVLYFNQKLTTRDSQRLEKTNTELIDLVTKYSGTYYLPYQLYYSKEQLQKAYPELPAFMEMKQKYDPNNILTNTWFEKYK